jgi:hypothetical protein
MLANKELGWYWNIIKIPLLICVLLIILSFALTAVQMMIPFLPIIAFIMWPIKILTIVILSGYVGWSAVKKYKAETIQYCMAGAMFGLILGALSAIMAIISSVITMASIGAMGKNVAMAGTFGLLGLIGGIISGGFTFVFTFSLGVVLALIGGLIAQNTK